MLGSGQPDIVDIGKRRNTKIMPESPGKTADRHVAFCRKLRNAERFAAERMDFLNGFCDFIRKT